VGGGVEVIRIADPEDPRYRQFRLNERGLASRTGKRDDAGAGLFLAIGHSFIFLAYRTGETGAVAPCAPTKG